MTKVMYRTGLGQISIIRKVEIERETPSNIWEVGGGTERKKSGYHQYHETLSEAKAHLLQKQQDEVRRLQLHLDVEVLRLERLVAKLEAISE